jgi:diketogulonate reductase-like aldo/keto reductase
VSVAPRTEEGAILQLGLGPWPLKDDEAAGVVVAAVEAGDRRIGTPAARRGPGHLR